VKEMKKYDSYGKDYTPEMVNNPEKVETFIATDKHEKCECDFCIEEMADPAEVDGIRILTICVEVKKVCPEKKVFVACILYDNCKRIVAFKGFTGVACGEDYGCGTITRKLVFVLPTDEKFEPSKIDIKVIANYLYPCECK